MQVTAGGGEVNDQKEYISLGHFVFIIRICLPYLGRLETLKTCKVLWLFKAEDYS